MPCSGQHHWNRLTIPAVARRGQGGAAGTLSLALVLAGAAGTAHPEQLPLWEVGLGAAAIDFQDYPGSDERSTYMLPLPYVVYRGDVLRFDREGLRGLLLESDRIQFDISANASIPVK